MTTDTIQTKHQIWTYPLATEEQPSLVRLTPATLSLAKVPSDDLDKTVAGLENGGDVVAQNIPLGAITKLDGLEGASELTVTFKQGESKTESATITLMEPSQRDELMNALMAQLGPGWERKRRQQNRWLEALWPLVAVVVVALVTWWMHGEAVSIAEGNELKAKAHTSKARLARQVMLWVEGWIGPTGVLILGGVLGCLCLAWLIQALAKPPIKIIIAPEGAKCGDTLIGGVGERQSGDWRSGR